jgi:hypothetical protein
MAIKAMGKFGLSCKRFTKSYQNQYEDLADEEHFIKKDFAQFDEQKQAKKNQQGQLIMDDSKEKELVAALKSWKKEPIEFEFDHNKFAPVKLEGKDIFVSAVIYEELNGFVFDVTEEEYLEAIESEVAKQETAK